MKASHYIRLFIVAFALCALAVALVWPRVGNRSMERYSDGKISERAEREVGADEIDKSIQATLGTPSSRGAGTHESNSGGSPNTSMPLVSEFQSANKVQQQLAWDSAYRKVSTVNPARIKRWQLVDLNASSLMPEGVDSDEFAEKITVEFFPDQRMSFVRTNVSHDIGVPAVRWSGITPSPTDSSVQGVISIHMIRNPEDSTIAAYIHYSDKYQDLHVVPVDNTPFYISVETEKYSKPETTD